MKGEKYNKWLVAVFFLLLQVLIIIRNISANEMLAFLWFCDYVPLLFAIGFLIKETDFVKALINVGFLSQLISFIFLMVAVLFKADINGYGDILKYSPFYIAVSVIIHVFSVNTALYITARTRPTKRTVIYSCLLLALIFATSILFTPVSQNMNYVYSSEYLGFRIPYYTQLWLFIGLMFIVLPTQAIQYGIYRFTSKEKQA